MESLSNTGDPLFKIGAYRFRLLKAAATAATECLDGLDGQMAWILWIFAVVGSWMHYYNDGFVKVAGAVDSGH